MFTGPDQTLHSILDGILAAAAALYALGTIAVIAAIRAEPARARNYARLAGVVKAAPFLVGLACLGSVIDAIDLRPQHETDLFARWPALLPQVALLSAGAGFLSGLLAGARPVWVALAAGGPMAAVSLLFCAVTGWIFVATGSREGFPPEPELRQAVPHAVWDFFEYLVLFPIVAVAASASGAGVGRWLRGLLGPPGDETQSGRSPAPPPTSPTVPAAPFLQVPELPGTPSFPASLPAPAPTVPESAPARELPPFALPRPATRAARWPGSLLFVLGVLLMTPAGCHLLMPKASFVASEPEGGAVLRAAPSDVGLTFSGEVSPSSTIKVRRTVTLDWAGREDPTGGTPVADASGESALSVDRRSLRVRLPEGSPGGLYLVEWRTVRAARGDERYGDLYFGVGMKIPRSIRDGGAPRESDPYSRERREALGGGVLAILFGFASRWHANALRGR